MFVFLSVLASSLGLLSVGVEGTCRYGVESYFTFAPVAADYCNIYITSDGFPISYQFTCPSETEGHIGYYYGPSCNSTNEIFNQTLTDPYSFDCSAPDTCDVIIGQRIFFGNESSCSETQNDTESVLYYYFTSGPTCAFIELGGISGYVGTEYDLDAGQKTYGYYQYPNCSGTYLETTVSMGCTEDNPFPFLDDGARSFYYHVVVAADPPFEINYTESCDADACAGIDQQFCCQVSVVQGIRIVQTPRSFVAYPEALYYATLTIDYMVSRLDDEILAQLDTHIIYVYHGDVTMQTGVSAEPKLDKYDYLSDIYGFSVDTFDGRTFDAVYGYGGIEDVSNPTSVLDCNLLSYCYDDRFWTISVLVHEFAHTIRNIGVRYGDNDLYQELDVDAYNQYLENVPDASLWYAYCGTNSDEMFACAAQVWFASTFQYWAINPGLYTVGLIQTNVPLLYDGLTELFGPSVEETILPLENVVGMPNYPDWLFYDDMISQYTAPYFHFLLHERWNLIKHITEEDPCGDLCETCDGIECTDCVKGSFFAGSTCVDCRETFGLECNWCRDNEGCMSCRPGFTREMDDETNLYYCDRTAETTDEEMEYATVPCQSDNCLTEFNEFCADLRPWGCAGCQAGYFRKDNDHLCVECSIIPGCTACESTKWGGCDTCESGEPAVYDFVFGYRRCIS